MTKVDFTYANGRTRAMSTRDAEILRRLGKGEYRTTHVTQAPQRAVLTPAAQHIDPPVVQDVREPQNEPEVSLASGEPDPVDAEPETLDLASMSVEELREYAKRQGVQVHHRAGAATILQALSK